MSKIKVSELFYSLQGEGKYMGVPSVFLRTFGCNFTCSGFGMKQGELSQERLLVDPEKYDDYKKLPLVHTGCDSYASWDPRFKNLSPLLSVEEIVRQMGNLVPKFDKNRHLIITGGEPLLGWQRSYPDLLDETVTHMGLTNVTFETNGTQPLTPVFKEWLEDAAQHIDFTFSVSAKLPNSGEQWEKAILPDVVEGYEEYARSDEDIYFKFVVSDESDLGYVLKAMDLYRESVYLRDSPVYLMPVGGTTETYNKNELNVAEMCKKYGFRFSPRIQVPLYKNAWGT